MTKIFPVTQDFPDAWALTITSEVAVPRDGVLRSVSCIVTRAGGDAKTIGPTAVSLSFEAVRATFDVPVYAVNTTVLWLFELVEGLDALTGRAS